MSASPSPFEQEYEQVNDNIRALADIRFKLLALIPPLGGVAIFLLSQAALTRQTNPPTPTPEPRDYALVLLLSLMGFIATLGVTIYDQRNSQLYNALIGRAKTLEKRLGMVGGQFSTRPRRARRLFGLVLMWHDLALTLIYGVVLGAWFFPLFYSGLRLARETLAGPVVWLDTVTGGWFNALRAALLVTLVMTLVFFEELLRLDGVWRGLRDRTYVALSGSADAHAEIRLLRNLKEIRRAIAGYKADNGAGPVRLEDLVSGGYLGKLPGDPVTGREWLTIREVVNRSGEDVHVICDIRSNTDAPLPERRRLYKLKAGGSYSDW